MSTVLKVNDITMQFGGVVAVNDLSMHVDAVSYTHLDVYKRQAHDRHSGDHVVAAVVGQRFGVGVHPRCV